MTGEASPGYLPYPEVVQRISRTMPGPKIICTGRNPLERSYSSYRYNYVQPTLEKFRKGRVQGIEKRQDDDFYQKYLFSFEDFIKSELKQLKACFNGFGIKATRDRWYSSNKWTQSEFDKRDDPQQELDPLIDLDNVCYGKRVNNKVLRPQWAEIQKANPEKVILSTNAFLVQSLIGRSLYVFPLEWWYILFQSSDITFMCTEELSDPDKLNHLAMQLGLPPHNFTDIVGKGAYNVGGHRGYDTVTPWKELEQEEEEKNVDSIIPLSEEVRQEYLDFVRPYNERLFTLIGKRCDWD